MPSIFEIVTASPISFGLSNSPCSDARAADETRRERSPNGRQRRCWFTFTFADARN